MKNIQQFITVLIMSSFIVSCGGGDSVPVTKVTTEPASALNGKIYFQHNCGGCHSAGEDNKTLFGAIDLKQKQDRVKSDMSEYGGFYKLMGRFTNIPKQRVEELKAYFSEL